MPMVSFLSTSTIISSSSSSLLPIHHKPTNSSRFLPLKPHFPSCFLHFHPNSSPQFSSSSSSSSKTPIKNTTPTPLITFTKNSFFLLLASLLFLSGLRPLPALSSPPTPAQETQEQEPEEQEQEETNQEEVKMYSEMLKKDPNDVDVLKSVLFIKMRNREWNDALLYIKRLSTIEPHEVEWRLMEALVCELMGNLGKAKKLYEGILEEWPLLLRALHGLAICMHKRLEGSVVFEMLEKALELAHCEDRVPEERGIKLLIAQMHVVKGQLDVASLKLQDLINEDPRDFRPHLCQGIVYALLEKKKEADEHFEIYRSLVPDEFPQKGFIDDAILSAKMESKDRPQKELESEFLYRK